MSSSIKNFLLESEAERDDQFAYLDGDVVSKVKNVNFNKSNDSIEIKFLTTYGKKCQFTSKLSDFKNWYSDFNLKGRSKTPNVFHLYLADFFSDFKRSDDSLNEIIDDTNEIMPDSDLPMNSSNSMVGTQDKHDAEKVLKKSGNKSKWNVTGTLGLGTVVW